MGFIRLLIIRVCWFNPFMPSRKREFTFKSAKTT